MKLPAAAEITALHDYALAAPGQPARFESGVWEAIETNHWHNSVLWEQEDLARRRHVPDSDIASNKRAIDTNNQKRNDAIERIDEMLLNFLEKAKKRPEAKQNSETPGAMIDRLSILSLKIHHMRLQAERTDVEPAHTESCLAKLQKLTEQRTDLAACLDRLLAEAARGESYFKVYRQFKAYNDPSLNPAMYGEASGTKR
jgi:Protein of unknown function (DUF4254)